MALEVGAVAGTLGVPTAVTVTGKVPFVVVEVALPQPVRPAVIKARRKTAARPAVAKRQDLRRSRKPNSSSANSRDPPKLMEVGVTSGG